MTGVVESIRAETAGIIAWLGDLAGLLPVGSANGERLAGLLLHRLDLLIEFREVRGDGDAATGAHELTLRLEPSDLALRLMAALRAGDGDLGAVEAELRHLSFSSVGLVDRPGETESPGASTGAPGDEGAPP